MSYAAVASHNIAPQDHGALPDPGLLEGSHSTPSVAQEDDANVHVVQAEEAAALRAAIEKEEAAAEPSSFPTHTVEFTGEAYQHETLDQKIDQLEEEAAEVKEEAKSELKEGEKHVKDAAAKGEKKVKEGVDKAEKKAEELKEKAKKEAKKLGKKASELDAEARAAARKYPIAATGIVGLVNLAIIGTAGLVAYTHWDQPRWDRRAVTAATVGLLAVFGAEGALGYWEYEKNEEETK